MNRLDYYRAVLFGVVIGMVFITGFYVFISPGENVKPAEALDSKGSFTVVDNYKGCDVVQWHYSMLAEYKYFLVCDNKQN
jgi:hypothetical protein